MQRVIDHIERQRDRFERELVELLRIPSVSADPARRSEVHRACDLLADWLGEAGVDVEVVQTDGNPLLVGEARAGAEKPTLLIYGHYDVQPPDPLDQWVTGPFEPTVRDGSIYARGASDDKGQMVTHLNAVRAWLGAEGRVPVNIKILVEGEEEIGSRAVDAYLRANADRLACDYVVISDCCMFGPDRPSITYGLKGMAYFEVALQGPKRDLHSGSFGGSVQNPVNALCELLASLKDPDGRIAIPGFYDDVSPLTDAERARIDALPFDEDAYRRQVGVEQLFGEAGHSTTERRWARPTCDINGIFGGYQGEGAKTIVPASAGAKLSFRLVPDQDPERVGSLVRRHLETRLPPGVTLSLVEHSGALPVITPLDGIGVQAASRALEQAFGTAPVYIREGGSIPIVSAFKEVLGADCLLLGFGLSDDNLHAPNEKFSLKDFHRGIKTSAYLFEALADLSS